jgi:hypothetical protein
MCLSGGNVPRGTFGRIVTDVPCGTVDSEPSTYRGEPPASAGGVCGRHQTPPLTREARQIATGGSLKNAGSYSSTISVTRLPSHDQSRLRQVRPYETAAGLKWPFSVKPPSSRIRPADERNRQLATDGRQRSGLPRRLPLHLRIPGAIISPGSNSPLRRSHARHLAAWSPSVITSPHLSPGTEPT